MYIMPASRARLCKSTNTGSKNGDDDEKLTEVNNDNDNGNDRAENLESSLFCSSILRSRFVRWATWLLHPNIEAQTSMASI